MKFEVSNRKTALTNSSANLRPGVTAIARSLRFALGLVFLFITALTANASTFVVTNTNDTGPGSLRQAIIDASVQAGLDTVSFQIGTGPKTITLASDLPIVSNLVVIDATTQPGYAGAPIIEINGNHIAGFGLNITGGNSTVKGLVINNFTLSGILLRVNGNNTIANCYLGTSLDGMSSKGNAQSGISIEAGSSGNTIGGLLANLRNVISGNQFNGIQIAGDGGNFIEGNYIGTNAAGTGPLGNGQYGIRVISGGNSIGIELLSSRNVISGNLRGIGLDNSANSNVIAANYIGLDASGTSAIPNSQGGIEINSSNNIIGGTSPFARNVISGNGENGVFGSVTSGNVIEGNYIGTNAAGSGAVGNSSYGIRLLNVTQTRIGGTNAAARNVVSGNWRGISIEVSSSAGNLIQGNYVGLDPTGTVKIGNGSGIGVSGWGNTIGGIASGAGNVIANNSGDGIAVQDALNTIVQGNLIGTDPNGTVAMGNSGYGIRMSNVNNTTVGGTTAAARNVIANNGRGVCIENVASAGNIVQGNFIGVDISGSKTMANHGSGVELSGTNNAVGGTVPGAGNVIAGNDYYGIGVGGSGSTGNKIQGNMIGVDVTGTMAIANAYGGVSIWDASNTLIGGTSPEARNIISGNFRGVTIDGTGTGNLVQGNYIGTDITGAVALGNNQEGILIGAAGNTIGGTAAGSRNVISGNGGDGVEIEGIVATGNLVQGNFIGTKANGTDFLANGLIGVQINNSYNNLIGGTVPGTGNIVAGNNYAGVVIDAGTGDAILGNSIYGNARLGIELSGQDAIGLNENDYADPDAGANWKQNYPLLSSVTVSGGNTSIQGKLNSNPNKQFRLEFFANNNCGSTGFGEGQTIIGSTSVTTDGSGDAVINATLPVTPAGQFITATATSAANDTSEFSPCALVGGANPGVLQFESSFYLVEEFQGTATITVTRSSGMTGTVSVHYATSDGDATAPADYGATSGTLTFGDGEVIKTFTVPIVNDSDLNEQQESVGLTLSDPTGGATLGSQSTSDLLINYSDPTYPATGFSDATVVEGDNGTTNAVFTISVSEHSAPLTVGYATVPGLATSPADYQEKTGQLIFNPGENSKTVSVPVFGDSIAEGDEIFFLNLTSLSAGYTVKSQGQGLIIDDDGSSKLQFSSSAYSTNEGGGSVTITVTRTADTKPAVSVDYSTSDGTAKAGSDYTAAAGTLNFASGETSKTFAVNITGDSQVEGDESLNLKLSNASAGAFLGGPSAAVLTINDNQTIPGLSVSDVTLVEGNSGTTTFAFNVGLSAASAQNVTVDFATADGTAASGSDYHALNGSLTFNPGETSKTVNVLVNGDSQNEPDETFLVQLSNPANATLAKAQGTATITNDDSAQSQPTLSISDRTQAEGNSGTTIFGFSVVLSAASAQAVTVNFATGDGTATSGGDYQASSGSLIFNPGETSKTINVLVNGDGTQEPAETFFVDLSGATNAGILKARGTATIVDDDNANPVTSFQFAQPSYSVQEDSTALTVTVTRTGDTSGPASVDYTTVDDTANQKGDYEFAAGTLRFAANEVSQTLPVLINEDSYVESTEQFNLTLSNPTGAILGAQSTATVSIADDALELPANPIDDAENFVRMQYHDFLNREADPAGLAFWTNEITSCGSDQTCVDRKRVNVSAAFFLSIEFQQTGYLVHRMYTASYGHFPGATVPVHFDEFMRDAQEIRRDVVVNQPGWEQVLDNDRKTFIARFVQRPRFTSAYPGTLTPAQLVDALFANAGVTPAPADRQAAIDEFAGSLSSADDAARGRALQRVADNPTLVQQEFDPAFVLIQYFGYLRRNPNDAPEPGLNFDGCNFWVNKLNQFNNNYGDAEMIKSFVVSGEYRQRFGQ